MLSNFKIMPSDFITKTGKKQTFNINDSIKYLDSNRSILSNRIPDDNISILLNND